MSRLGPGAVWMMKASGDRNLSNAPARPIRTGIDSFTVRNAVYKSSNFPFDDS